MISCLRAAGVEVVEAHMGVWEGKRDAWEDLKRARALLTSPVTRGK